MDKVKAFLLTLLTLGMIGAIMIIGIFVTLFG